MCYGFEEGELTLEEIEKVKERGDGGEWKKEGKEFQKRESEGLKRWEEGSGRGFHLET